MTARDEIEDAIMAMRAVDITTARGVEALADRIIALLPPREPTEAMVEAMARAMHQEWRRQEDFPRFGWDDLTTDAQNDWRDQARAAWAAGYAKGEER